MSRQAFIDAARALKGARWRHRGRSPRAVDCIGLVTLAARGARMAVEDAAGYGREPWDDRLRRECAARFGAPLPVIAAQPGDVAVFRFHKGEPSHVGILAEHPDGGLSLIHSQQLRGVVEQRLAGAMLESIVEVYRPTWGTP
jgi:cell wall-associated NlpC family hydrolase